MADDNLPNWAVSEINQAISMRGYLVIGSNTIQEVGDKIEDFYHDNVHIGNPFRVILETDRADFEEQARIAWPDDQDDLGTWRYYYRCIND